MDNRPIGVFDSGIGGLTVLDKLIEKLPNEDFVYVADQGHCPYGRKSDDEIFECVKNVINYLLSRNVKAIVIACNTASLFVEKARKLTDVPIISVIEPTCDRAMEKTKNGNILILATIATINKGKYQERIKNGGLNPTGVPASDFVDFVENHELDDPIGQEIVNRVLEPYKNSGFDTVIHGCTHFSILEDKMRKVLGDITYVACGDPTGDRLMEILEEKDAFNMEHDSRYTNINTTGDVEKAIMTMKWFKKPHGEITHIEV